MDISSAENLSIECRHCSRVMVFDQPYIYHAGFADQGFLYNDAGTLTLVWSIVDPVLNELFPNQPAWTNNPLNRLRFEKLLLPAPQGGHWRFRNPARCTHCGKPIAEPMRRSVHYLVYPGSVIVDPDKISGLRKHLKLTH